MAYNNSISARLDELRSPNTRMMTNDTSKGQSNSFRYSGSFMTPPQATPTSTAAETPSLQRRFTADLSKMSSIAPIGQMPTPAHEPLDMPTATFKKAKLLEDKRNEYLAMQEHRKNFQAQMEAFAQQSAQQEAREQAEIDQITAELQKAGFSPGHQSEPTTPPEYRDQVFPSAFSRPNRYSSSSLASPPGLTSRSHRSGSQLTSPPADIVQSLSGHANLDSIPSKSVPGSRRGSNDRVTAYVPETNGSARRSATSNRYSMPITGLRGRTHESVPENSASMGLGHLNTTSFLFDDDEKPRESATSPDAKSYVQMTDDNFPILVRRDEYPGVLSASSAALDLALSQSPSSGVQTPPHRQRFSEQSYPSSTLNALSGVQTTASSAASKSPENVGNHRQLNRHSMEASLAAYAKSTLPNQISGVSDSSRPALSHIHPSYSTNDVPTLKTNRMSAADLTPPKSQAQQQFHNHNASLGRIPPNAINRHSRDLSGDSRRDDANPFQQISSVLQASAPPFSVPATATSPTDSMPAQMGPYGSNVNAFQSQQYFGGYGVQMMNLNPMQGSNPLLPQQLQLYQPQNGFASYPNPNASYGGVGRFQDSQTRVIQQRRVQNGEEQARFNNVQLETIQGEILSLCKDQHGCRYLQKKLEERNPQNVQMIFLETHQHVVELMTDPFGNYLCQKLLEYSNDEQRTQLIHNAASEMVKIALNSHGTRALQKMIEFISTPEQTQTIINALKDRVVELIQDLNGNHVIQKCLNRLSAQDAQFIFNAVGENCVVVGTHRHGCCVLQRCIDHATGYQRAHLISQITDNAFQLVQDPFGNYVLQYIVDLQEPCFTDPLCYTFQGQIPQLSKQKFSSNVIEKCLRGAQHSVTRMMIEEMLNTNELEKMLRDSYANYVVQTAMDYADAEMKTRLVEAIRPILPSVRQTPHGRRIQSKISAIDGQGRFSGSGTPTDRSGGQTPLGLQMTTSALSNPQPAPAPSFNTFMPPSRGAYPTFASQPTPQTFGNPNFMHFEAEPSPNNVQPPASFARIPQLNGGFF